MKKLSPRPPKKPYITDQQALDFHSKPIPGKLALQATKPMATQRDLSLAYSPGVAIPVKAIASNALRILIASTLKSKKKMLKSSFSVSNALATHLVVSTLKILVRQNVLLLNKNSAINSTFLFSMMINMVRRLLRQRASLMLVTLRAVSLKISNLFYQAQARRDYPFLISSNASA